MDKEEQENELAKLSKAIDILPYQHWHMTAMFE
jgi:hypothetical protein